MFNPFQNLEKLNSLRFSLITITMQLYGKHGLLEDVKLNLLLCDWFSEVPFEWNKTFGQLEKKTNSTLSRLSTWIGNVEHNFCVDSKFGIIKGGFNHGHFAQYNVSRVFCNDAFLSVSKFRTAFGCGSNFQWIHPT